MVIGTHGRSIYKAPLTQLEKYNSIKNKAVALFKLKNQDKSTRWGSSRSDWSDAFEPKFNIPYYVSKAGSYTMTIKNKEGVLLNSLRVKADAGFNNVVYNLDISQKWANPYLKNHKELKKAKNGKYYLAKGKYTVALQGGEQTTFEVK